MAARASDRSGATEILRPVRNDRLEIRNEAGKGRGVFAREAIPAGALIEAAPVIVMTGADCALVDKTILHDYYFHWDGDPDGPDGTGVLALGLVSLCNHARRPRARVKRNFVQSTLDLFALSPIAAGDEVTIDYNCPLWFAPRD